MLEKLQYSYFEMGWNRSSETVSCHLLTIRIFFFLLFIPKESKLEAAILKSWEKILLFYQTSPANCNKVTHLRFVLTALIFI